MEQLKFDFSQEFSGLCLVTHGDHKDELVLWDTEKDSQGNNFYYLMVPKGMPPKRRTFKKEQIRDLTHEELHYLTKGDS